MHSLISKGSLKKDIFTPEEEETLAKSLRISIRCVPQGEMGCAAEAAPCILTGRPTTRRVLWARSY